MIEDLLIDFDEMGFMPTTTCEDPNEYALEWKQKLIAEIELIKDEARKETAKEILSDIDFNLKISDATKEPKSNDYYNVVGWIEEIAKEYGVEVEE